MGLGLKSWFIENDFAKIGILVRHSRKLLVDHQSVSRVMKFEMVHQNLNQLEPTWTNLNHLEPTWFGSRGERTNLI